MERRSGGDRRQGDRRRIGRPRVAGEGEGSQIPAVRCSVELHDRIVLAASRRSASRGVDVTVAQTVRELLERALDDDERSAPRNPYADETSAP
jgi:hypothetical protein